MKNEIRDPGATQAMKTSRKLCLTNTAVKAALPGETLWDTDVTGLHLRVRTGGAAYFLYYRTKTRRERRPKLGDARVVQLGQARDIARAKLAVVAAGGDPEADIEAVIESPTVAVLFERVYCDHWAGKKTRNEIRRRFEVYVKKRLGQRRVRELTYDEVLALHASLKATPYQANRVLSDLGKMLAYAERPLKWRDQHTNPCTGIEPFAEKKRKKFFKGEHLQRLIPALERYAADEHAHPATRRDRRHGAAFLTFLLYTGARPEEPEAITPEMVEVVGDAGVARLPDAKTGQRDIFIPPVAMRALRSLPWVKGRPIFGSFPKRVWNRIRKEADCGELWARDARRTFGTAVGSTMHGASTGLLLGHASTQTTKRYLELIEDEAHKAAAAGADRIDQLAGR